MSRPGRILILVILAAGAYLPALRLPFIEDDNHEIPLARDFAAAGWTPLWYNSALRTHVTSMAVNAGLDRVFGFKPPPFYAVSILVHVLCVLLVYAACVWREVLDEKTAFWAACFFAVYEGHQEAVMWISARTESTVFLFGMLAWVCWVKYLHGAGARWYSASIISFLLAALSKESFVIFPILMLLPLIWLPQGMSRKTALAAISPFFAITAAYLAWTWFGRIAQPDFSDNRFSLLAPWPLVLARSFWKLMFVWGIAALAILLWLGKRADRGRASLAIVWMLLGIFPYSFLTYMSQIASRHTYIASAGLAFLAGAAAARLSESNHRTLLRVVCAIFLIVNLEILWVKKMSQFRERAEPSELLKAAARQASGPISITCTPFPDFLAAAVVSGAGGRAVFHDPSAHEDHCFTIDYTNSNGAHIHIDRRIRTAKHGLFN